MLFWLRLLAIIINPSLGTKYLNSSTDYQNFKQFLKTPKYSFETELKLA
jgi:hypothetical protein